MKLLGIDYGRRRIGVAVTDESGHYIRSVAVIDRKTTPNWRQSLLKVIEREAPALLVVGVALDANDRETTISLEARRFGNELAATVMLPVNFVDEGFSSRRARQLLHHRPKKDRRNKQNEDRLAACLILQTYLQECCSAGDNKPLEAPCTS